MWTNSLGQKARSNEMRIPGLPIRDCTTGCNNRAQMCLQLSAINVTFEKILWAFVFSFRNGYTWTLSQLSLCTHNSDRLMHNYISILVKFFSLNFLVITIYQVIWPSDKSVVRDSPCIRIHISTIKVPPSHSSCSCLSYTVCFSISPSFQFLLVPYLMQTEALVRYFVIVGQPVRTCWFCNATSCARIFGNLEFESLYTRLSCGSLCSYARC